VVGRDDLAYAAGVAFGVVLLVMSGYADRSPEIVMHNDFAVLWGGSRTILDGGTPYDPAAFVATTARYGTERPPIYNVYTYPGWVAVALIPLALLPVPVASAIWTIGGALAAVAALRLLLRRYCSGVPVIHTLAGLTLFASQPGRLTVLLGQWGFVLLAASAAAVALLSAGRAGRAGASASVFIAKPGAAPRPFVRFTHKQHLHRIILNVSDDFGVMSRIPNISIEILLLPKSSRAIQHLIGFA